MLQKPASCEQCPLYLKGQGFVPDKIQPKEKYRFIGEAPGKQEIQGKLVNGKVIHEPFIGKAGFVLHSWLIHAVPHMKLAYDKKEISFANTLRCLPPEVQGRPYPKGDEKTQAEACCRPLDTPFHGVHTVVLFGESPQRRWFAQELEAEDASDSRLGREVKGVAGRMGRVYERDGVRFVFAPHPAWILRQPSLVEHGQSCLRIASGEEKKLEVKYVTWNEALAALA